MVKYNMSRNRFFKDIARLIRISEWTNKLLLIFAAAMIMIIWNQNSEGFFAALIFMFIYGCFGGAYGYFINSYFDQLYDEQVKKYLEVGYLTKKQHIVVLVLLGLPTLLMPFYYRNLIIGSIGLAIFFLITFYSAPPLRFKERNFIGPIVAALVQRPLPFYFFTLLISANSILTLFLLVWLFLIGLSTIFAHQLLDFENDLKTGVKTLAQSLGFSGAYKLPFLSICATGIFIYTAPLFFGLVNGLALSMALSVFSGSSINYSISALYKSKKSE